MASEREIAVIKALLHEIGNAMLNLSETLQDEGDRVYLASTNDRDMMRELGAKYWEWRIGEMP
jgi:hypothetical protein